MVYNRGMGRHRTNIYLDEDQQKLLRHLAAAIGVPVAELVRRSISGYWLPQVRQNPDWMRRFGELVDPNRKDNTQPTRGSAGSSLSRRLMQPKSKRPASKPTAWSWLASPPRGSKTEVAVDFGVDLTLLASNLRRTPAERLRALSAVSTQLHSLRSEVRRSKKRS